MDTYTGGRRESVIDYVIENERTRESVRRLKIEKRVEFGIHSRIPLRVETLEIRVWTIMSSFELSGNNSVDKRKQSKGEEGWKTEEWKGKCKTEEYGQRTEEGSLRRVLSKKMVEEVRKGK